MVSGDKFYQLFSRLVIFLLGLSIISILIWISQWDYSPKSAQLVMAGSSTYTPV